MNPGMKRWLPVWVAALLMLVGVLGGLIWVRSVPAWPIIPPASSTVTVSRPMPNVLVAVKDLARLETASFHMERVIDLTDKQSRLFGLVEAEDGILLVAVANISAGVDLQKLTSDDVVVDAAKKSVKIILPPAEIFHAELDNGKTYVHTRNTGALATRQENLETRARQEAERTLINAALSAGILTRAGDNAKRAVDGIVRSLGYDQIEITVRPSPSISPVSIDP